MKTFFKSSTVLFVFLITVFSSCQKEEVFTADDYVGSWTCDESSSQNGASKFTIHIKKGSSANQLIFENLYNYGFNVLANATIDEASLSFPSQTFSAQGTTLSGSGVLDSKTKLTLSYTITDGAGTDNVTAVCTKQ